MTAASQNSKFRGRVSASVIQDSLYDKPSSKWVLRCSRNLEAAVRVANLVRMRFAEIAAFEIEVAV